MEDVDIRTQGPKPQKAAPDALTDSLGQSATKPTLSDPLSSAQSAPKTPQAETAEKDKDKNASEPKASKPKEELGEARFEPNSIASQVDAVLKLDSQKDKAAFVKAMMGKDPAFLPAFAARPEGKAVLTAMVSGSASDYIPSFGRVLDVFGAIPTAPTRGGGIATSALMLPFGIVIGTLGGIQSLFGRLWSAMPGSHRDFIVQVIEQQFELKVESSWSEGAVRSLYMAFKDLPAGHVSETVDEINHDGGISSWYKNEGGKRKILMGRLLPTSISMGSGEVGSRLIGQKFLKTNSVYSQRMRNKNAFTMTALHEVGHAVDARRNIMGQYGSKELFGGWAETSQSNLVEDMMAAYRGPQVTFTALEAIEMATNSGKKDLNDTFIKDKEGTNKDRQDKRVESRSLQEANNKIEKGAKDRAWTQAFGASETALKAIFKEYVSGKSISNAVAAHAETKDLSWWQRRALTGRIEAHPIVKMYDAGKKNGWMQTTAELAAVSKHFDGKAFHMSYPGPKNQTDQNGWVSYSAAAKKHAVSHYQWRAPGEWFAEIYAHYFMGTLSGHPIESWMAAEIAQKIEPETGAAKSPEVVQKEQEDAEKAKDKDKPKQGNPA